MSVNVYAWPPVAAVGSEWTEDSPVQMSRSMTTGAERTSIIQRKRRLVRLSIPGIGYNTYAAGYMEVLKRYLEGVHMVRLYSFPINWHFDTIGDQATRQSAPVLWTTGGVDLEWEIGSGTELLWYSGTILSGTTGTSGAFPIITVSGLPPNTLVARPGEFITAFEDGDDTTGTTVMISRPATSDGSGVAVIYLFEALPAGTAVRVNLGVQDTGVFNPYPYPRAVQPQSGNWTYEWSFREVFADEYDGGFVEINPWS